MKNIINFLFSSLFGIARKILGNQKLPGSQGLSNITPEDSSVFKKIHTSYPGTENNDVRHLMEEASAKIRSKRSYFSVPEEISKITKRGEEEAASTRQTLVTSTLIALKLIISEHKSSIDTEKDRDEVDVIIDGYVTKNEADTVKAQMKLENFERDSIRLEKRLHQEIPIEKVEISSAIHKISQIDRMKKTLMIFVTLGLAVFVYSIYSSVWFEILYPGQSLSAETSTLQSSEVFQNDNPLAVNGTYTSERDEFVSQVSRLFSFQAISLSNLGVHNLMFLSVLIWLAMARSNRNHRIKHFLSYGALIVGDLVIGYAMEIKRLDVLQKVDSHAQFEWINVLIVLLLCTLSAMTLEWAVDKTFSLMTRTDQDSLSKINMDKKLAEEDALKAELSQTSRLMNSSKEDIGLLKVNLNALERLRNYVYWSYSGLSLQLEAYVNGVINYVNKVYQGAEAEEKAALLQQMLDECLRQNDIPTTRISASEYAVKAIKPIQTEKSELSSESYVQKGPQKFNGTKQVLTSILILFSSYLFGSIVSAQPPVVMNIAIDLSDRITKPDQLRRDKNAIMTAWELFEQKVSKQGAAFSRDVFRVSIIPMRGIDASSFEADMCLELATIPAVNRELAVAAFKKRLGNTCDKLYAKITNAYSSNKQYAGADLYKYVNDVLPYDVGSGAYNQLVLITDSQVLFEYPRPKRSAQEFYSTAPILKGIEHRSDWAQKLSKDFVLAAPNHKLTQSLHVILIGAETLTSDPEELDKLQKIWSTWTSTWSKSVHLKFLPNTNTTRAKGLLIQALTSN